jgi:hypothetical protein
VLRWFCAAVTAAVVSGFALLLVTGRYISDGPVLAKLGGGHGVHLGDVFVLAGWVVAMVMLVVLAGPLGRGVPRPADRGGAAERPVPVNRGDRPAPSR